MSPTLLVALMTAYVIAAVMPMGSFPALLPHFTTLWNLRGAEGGAIVAAHFVGYMLTVPLLVSLTDRMDGRRLMIAGCLLAAAGNIGFAIFADGVWTAAAWRFIGGIGLGALYVPGMRAMTDRLDSVRHARAVTVYTGSFAIGTAFSFAGTVLVADSFGWRAAFIATGAGPLLSLAITLMALAPRPPPRSTGPARHPLDWRPLFRNRAALGLIALGFGHMVEFSANRSWSVAYLTTATGHSGATSILGLPPALIAGMTSFLILPFSLLGTDLAQRFGRDRALAAVVGLSFLVSCATGLGVVLPVWVAVLLICLQTGAVASDSGILNSGAVASAKPGELGMTMSAYSTITFGASAVGPMVMGFSFDIAGGIAGVKGWTLGFGLCALAPILGLVAMRLLGRRA